MKLSVLMMVKNGVSTIERALTPLKGIANEVCMHDTGSTDGTVDFTNRLCERLGFKFWCIRSSYEHSSDKFFLDEQPSFKRFVPSWQDSFTGKPILADWSWGLNEALSLCQAPYVLRLDADDVVLDPSNILPTLEMLDARPDIDIVSCPYEIWDPTTNSLEYLYMGGNRLWRRGKARFVRAMHEQLGPRTSTNWIMAAAGLGFRDMRDSVGDGIRVQGRNAKVLVYEWERRTTLGLDIDRDYLFTMGHEMATEDPRWALEILGGIKAYGLPADFRADILYHMGRACENLGHLEDAYSHYSGSILASPTANALLRRGLLNVGTEVQLEADLREGQLLSKRMGSFNTDMRLLERAKSLVSI